MIAGCDPDACTCLKVGLALGAFIAVASLFSILSLWIGVQPLSAEPAPAYPIAVKQSAGLILVGEVAGVMSDEDPHAACGLRFSVAPGSGSAPIDMDRVIVTLMTADSLEILDRSQTPIPRPGEWAIAARGNSGKDSILADGEVCDIHLALPCTLHPGSECTLKIRPVDADPLTIRQTIPIPS
ncbi:flagellin flab1 [hydrocarbon metagenome]|uniref:Flagellin flab1 n=1 Tax=hydrocarbon metagenome TaxID=938273 RepID=A0A0W8FJR0_9ZZZZ|nr:hypothetical protein [Methanomicrobiaceae archaeon]